MARPSSRSGFTRSLGGMKYRLNLSTLAPNVEGESEIPCAGARLSVYGGSGRTLANGIRKKSEACNLGRRNSGRPKNFDRSDRAKRHAESGCGLGRRLGGSGLRVLLSALQLPFSVLLGAAFALAACGARILRASHSGRLSSRGFSVCRGNTSALPP